MVKVENKENFVDLTVHTFFYEVGPKYDAIFYANPIICHLSQDRFNTSLNGKPIV